MLVGWHCLPELVKPKPWTVKSEPDKTATALGTLQSVSSTTLHQPLPGLFPAALRKKYHRYIIFIPLATMGQPLAAVDGTKGQWRQEGGDSCNRRRFEL